MSSPKRVTELLRARSGGDQSALDQLIPLTYDELRRLAAHYHRQERANHTLQPTALVHEAYLRLIDQKQMQGQNRAHFLGAAAQVMRRILVDHARQKCAAKRDGAEHKLTLDEEVAFAGERDVSLLALDDALIKLETLDPQKSRIVELRFFGGLSIEGMAEVPGISRRTVTRQCGAAKAWLHREISRAQSL